MAECELFIAIVSGMVALAALVMSIICLTKCYSEDFESFRCNEGRATFEGTEVGDDAQYQMEEGQEDLLDDDITDRT